MEYTVKILKIKQITPDTKSFITEKPKNYKFHAGQVTTISINKKNWKNKKRIFTFTSLNSDEFLEFIIKKYEEHNGVSKEMHKLKEGDELIIGEPRGHLEYRKEGIFISAGCGVTPFLAIFKELKKRGEIGSNKLILSNKKKDNIIYEDKLKDLLGENLILTLTQERRKGYEHSRIDKAFLKKYIQNFNQFFYICGSPKFINSIKENLIDLRVKQDNIIF